MKLIWVIFLIVSALSVEALESQNKLAVVIPSKKPHKGNVKPLVYGGIISRLGNQFFQVAAALSLGIDNQAPVYFPDFIERPERDIQYNGKKVFFRLNFDKPGSITEIYNENESLLYQPIPYKAGIKIVGYFQSEKFFAHNWDKIRPYFEPSNEVVKYLYSKYDDLLSHPLTVSIHVRNYVGENQSHSAIFETLDRGYYERAINFFPDEALFVIFSDDVSYAKKLLAGLARPHIFIEGNGYVEDFYLMSFMKHQIIANSSFSWWGAYLNQNPYKVVIAPRKWFNPKYHAKDNDIRPPQWLVL